MSSHKIHPTALFRLTVLGPLLSREQLERGAIQRMVRELAQKSYDISGTRRCHLSEKTIQAWYHAYRRAGIDALVPKVRADQGRSKLAVPIQEAIVAAKQDTARRSIRQILRTLEASGAVAAGSVSRSAVHRLLQQPFHRPVVNSASSANQPGSTLRQEWR